MRMRVNRMLQQRLPRLHAVLKAATARWRNAAIPLLPAPAWIAGRFTWIHPRLFASQLATATEPHIMRWVDQCLRPGDTFFDIGASCGLVSLRAARRVGPQGRVVAFEPSPVMARFLQYHCRVNRLRNTTAVPQAVADTDRPADFFLLNGGLSSRNSLTIGADNTPYVQPGEKLRIAVATTTLDRYTEQSGQTPDVIKIDVEGAELLVLKGACGLLRKRRPALIVGLHPYWLPAGQTPEHLFRLLDEYGYDVQESVTCGDPGCQTSDLLCVPRQLLPDHRQ